MSRPFERDSMTAEMMTRRRFLTLAAGGLGTLALACCGLAIAGTGVLDPIELESWNMNEEISTMKILVAYASRCGSTAGVAQTIGQVLAESGAAVDVRPVKQVRDLAGYQAVVVGSAIRIGKWLPEASKFVEKNRVLLSAMPLATFTCCLTLQEDTPEKRAEVSAYLDPIRAVVTPASEGMFAGALDLDKLPFLYRMMMQKMESPAGDYRDWQTIHAWAADLAPVLIPAAA